MMTLSRFLRVVGPSLFMVLGFAGAIVGQTETATVSGLVTDRTAAAVSEAEVRLQSLERGTVTATTTNNAGIYVFASVQPGQYQISIQKQGFKQVDLLGLIVNVQDHIEQNFRLEVGSVTESVTVEAGASMINTTDASVSTVVDQTYVKNMPLNGRSFQDLILLTPGTVTQTPQISQTNIPSGLGQTGEFSVNGQRTESNYYTVDGVSANLGATSGSNMFSGAGASGSVGAATALGTTQALVSVDALQEFRVQSSTYSAEYGRNPGGQFSFVTKSGTNQWHGTVYDYLRNNYFDANDWFNNYLGVKGAALRQNDFGGTLGGPVRIPHLYNGNDKTFFFFSYEGLRLLQPQPACTTCFVPDATLRASAPAPLNQVLNAWPLPSANGIDDTTNGFAQYFGSWSNPSSIDSTSVRFDHVLNDKLRFFFRFSDTESTSAIRGPFGDSPTLEVFARYTLRTYTAGASSVFSSRVSNDFRLNFSSNEAASHEGISAFGGSTPLDLRQLTGLGPTSDVQVALFIGPYFTFLEQNQSSGVQRQWNLVDTATLATGRHQLKFGMDFRRLAPVANQATPFVPYNYFDQPSVQTNSASTFIQVIAPAYPLYKNFSAFVQDEWRVSQRLSVSVGLRWEVNPAPGVTQGVKPYTVQGSSPNTWALAPEGTPLWQTAWYNFAPRLGVAYILHDVPGRETVVRGGGGVFFDTGQQLGSQGFNGPGFYATGGTVPATFPVVGAIPVIGNPPVAPYNITPRVFAAHLQLPYTLQWNASIEQALGKSQALTASYVGSHGSRLLQETFDVSFSNPNSALWEVFGSGLTSDYDSLQIQFRRRLSRGLTVLASYTWSHCIDYGSENLQLGYQRGNCDFDIRHNVAAALSYDLPTVGHGGFSNAMLHHWGLDDRLSARSGFPVTLNGQESLNPVTGQAFFDGLNLVPGQPIYLYGSNCDSILKGLGDLAAGQGCPGGRAINPQAFTNVSSGLGNAPRNFVHGFGAWQMDMAVRRDFPIHEGLKLQFRGEAFNVFNHPNFGAINSSFGQTTFGQATSTLANSLGILSPLYQMGGPRSMQLSLKVMF